MGIPSVQRFLAGGPLAAFLPVSPPLGQAFKGDKTACAFPDGNSINARDEVAPEQVLAFQARWEKPASETLVAKFDRVASADDPLDDPPGSSDDPSGCRAQWKVGGQLPRQSRRLPIRLLAVLPSILALLVSVLRAEPPRVFRAAPGVLVQSQYAEPWRDPSVVRNRLARIDADTVMRRYRHDLPLSFNLFEDAELRTEAGGNRVAGGGVAVLATSPEGLVAGQIDSLRGLFTIEPSGDDPRDVIIRELDRAALSPLRCGVGEYTAPSFPPMRTQTINLLDPGGGGGFPGSGGRTIDLLVVYDERLLLEGGGIDEANVKVRADVGMANTILNQSGLDDLNVRLVGIEVFDYFDYFEDRSQQQYDATGSYDIAREILARCYFIGCQDCEVVIRCLEDGDCVRYFRYPNREGLFDKVRKDWGADMLAVYLPNPADEAKGEGIGGLASGIGKPWGYYTEAGCVHRPDECRAGLFASDEGIPTKPFVSIVYPREGYTGRILIHEIGHNMGLRHSRQELRPDEKEDYVGYPGFGYSIDVVSDAASSCRATVMDFPSAYQCRSDGTFDKNGNANTLFPLTPELQFSNPESVFAGTDMPQGISIADDPESPVNASRLLREVWEVVADYQEAKLPDCVEGHFGHLIPDLVTGAAYIRTEKAFLVSDEGGTVTVPLDLPPAKCGEIAIAAELNAEYVRERSWPEFAHPTVRTVGAVNEMPGKGESRYELVVGVDQNLGGYNEDIEFPWGLIREAEIILTISAGSGDEMVSDTFQYYIWQPIAGTCESNLADIPGSIKQWLRDKGIRPESICSEQGLRNPYLDEPTLTDGPNVTPPATSSTPSASDLRRLQRIVEHQDRKTKYVLGVETDHLTTLSTPSLPNGPFQEWTNLKKLQIFAPVESLPEGVFDKQAGLEILELDGLRITSLPEGVFDSQVALKRLKLMKTWLASLPDRVFDNLGSLDYLRLQGNQLSLLPDGVFDNLGSLVYLNLSYNQLASLPDGVFDNLGSLRTLYLHANELTDLPDRAFEALHSLEGLTLNGNYLSAFPGDIFASLDDLTYLHLDANELSTLPPSIFSSVKKLTTLRLGINRLSTLPQDVFSGLRDLVGLELSDNRLSSSDVPQSLFSGLDSLEVLSLRNNPSLAPLPLGLFDALGQLKGLDLANTGLTSFPGDDLSALSSLERLWLAGNRIESITEGEFTGFGSVKSLDLEGNTIAEVPDHAFSGLHNLRWLSLGSNRISSIADDGFSGLGDLNELNLSYNNFTDFPLGLGGVSDSVKVYIAQNPFIAPQSEDACDFLREAPNLTHSIDKKYMDRLCPDATQRKMLIGKLQDLITLSSIAPDQPVREIQLHNIRYFPHREDLDTYVPIGWSNPIDWELVEEVRIGSYIQRLYPDSFAGMTGLKELDLSGNSLFFLPPGIFDDLSNLERLSLQGNYLVELSEGLFANLGKLRVLSIADNDPSYSNDYAVRNYIHPAELNTLPAGLFEGLSALDSLDLRGNALSELPAGLFEGLSALYSLYLGGNALSELPAGLFEGLSALTSLDLGGNALSELPAGLFDGLTALRSLDLGGNALSELPAGLFDGLTALRSLDLGGNALSELPAGLIDGLSALDSLDLGGNALSEISADAFSSLEILRSLKLSSNEIVSLPANSFSGIEYLRELDLSGNSISTVHSEAFSVHRYLESLDLSQNAITSLPEGVFLGLSALRDLDLSGNSLSVLSNEVFSGLRGVLSVDLSDNPLGDSVFSERVCDFLKGVPQVIGVRVDIKCPSNIPSGLSGGTASDIVVNYLEDRWDPAARTSMQFVRVPAGQVALDGRGRYDGQARIDISQDFYISRFELTNVEWITAASHGQFSSSNAEESADECGPYCPVTFRRGPREIEEFIGMLNQIEGGGNFRLPYEWEWVHAARAMTNTDTYVGDLSNSAVDPVLDSIAWYQGNSEGRKHPVGRKKANAFGLHDMFGNVRELTQGWRSYPETTVTDSQVTGEEVKIAPRARGVFHGCGFGDPASLCQLTVLQDPSFDWDQYGEFGLRLVMTELGENSVVVDANSLAELPSVQVAGMNAHVGGFDDPNRRMIDRWRYIDWTYEGGPPGAEVTVPPETEVEIEVNYQLAERYPLDLSITFELEFEASDGSDESTMRWLNAGESSHPGRSDWQRQIPMYFYESDTAFYTARLLDTGATEGWVTVRARLATARGDDEFTEFVGFDGGAASEVELPVLRFYVGK